MSGGPLRHPERGERPACSPPRAAERRLRDTVRAGLDEVVAIINAVLAGDFSETVWLGKKGAVKSIGRLSIDGKELRIVEAGLPALLALGRKQTTDYESY